MHSRHSQRWHDAHPLLDHQLQPLMQSQSCQKDAQAHPLACLHDAGTRCMSCHACKDGSAVLFYSKPMRACPESSENTSEMPVAAMLYIRLTLVADWAVLAEDDSMRRERDVISSSIGIVHPARYLCILADFQSSARARAVQMQTLIGKRAGSPSKHACVCHLFSFTLCL